MLDCEKYGETPVPIRAGERIGADVLLAFEPDTKMQCRVCRRSRDGAPTLLIRGEERAEQDWFGVEVMLPPDAHTITVTARNYPADRLYPRLHMRGADGKPFHLNLPDQAAADHFVERRFALRELFPDPAFWTSGITMHRLTILVPPSPWFVMEIADIHLLELADA